MLYLQPWRVRYRKEGSPTVMTARLSNPNDFIEVNDKGTYEIIEVFDSQCPGTVSQDSSSFTVDWIPRPTARLADESQAQYNVYNHSFILNPVCEGIPAHVDLDLTGMFLRRLP